MKYLLILSILISSSSCIPVKVAPQFKNEPYKVMSAKKFQRKQTNQMAYIFMDTKNEGEVYQYFNKKSIVSD